MLLLQYAQFMVCLDAIVMRASADCALSQLAALIRQAITQVIQRFNAAHVMQASHPIKLICLKALTTCPAGAALASWAHRLLMYMHASTEMLRCLKFKLICGAHHCMHTAPVQELCLSAELLLFAHEIYSTVLRKTLACTTGCSSGE